MPETTPKVQEKPKTPKKPAAKKTVKLYYPHHVDLSQGQEPSAYGTKLVMVDGCWVGEMPTERAKVELDRGAFVKTKPKKQ